MFSSDLSAGLPTHLYPSDFPIKIFSSFRRNILTAFLRLWRQNPEGHDQKCRMESTKLIYTNIEGVVLIKTSKKRVLKLAPIASRMEIVVSNVRFFTTIS
jgi:hypothetical protein